MTEEWSGELTALEERAAIESLEHLHAERRSLIEANAKLFALYGNFGHYDDHRKRMVEALKVAARMELTKAGVKITEDLVTATAYGSDRYQQFIDNALDEKIQYLKAQNEVDELNELIRARELALTAYSREISLR
jgi:hypothetical protein